MGEQSISFDIENLAVLRFGDFELWITESHLATWIIMGVLVVFAVIARIKLRNFKEVPKGFQNVVETMVEYFDNFLNTSAGKKQAWMGGWFFSVFAFLLISNTSGVFTLRNPTADWTVTFAFAFVTFILLTYTNFRYGGWRFGVSLLNPLDFIGELARPVSLSFRLFGNILAGMILMTLLYSMAPFFVRFVLPIPLHLFFDLFAGALHAYIFCVLSMSFIGAAADKS